MDSDFQCFLCPFASTSVSEFSNHVIRFHKNDPGFLVKCTFCGATYQKYDSLCRKHTIYTDRDLSVDDSTEYNVSDSDSNMTFQQEVNCKVAGMIVKLKGKHNVSQTVVIL